MNMEKNLELKKCSSCNASPILFKKITEIDGIKYDEYKFYCQNCIASNELDWYSLSKNIIAAKKKWNKNQKRFSTLGKKKKLLSRLSEIELNDLLNKHKNNKASIGREFGVQREFVRRVYNKIKYNKAILSE